MVCLSNFFNLLSTCFGFGLISWIPASGTFISLLSIIPWYLLNSIFDWKILFILLILMTILGCYSCHQTNKYIGIHDHKCIVLDEFIGMWYVLILSPGHIDCVLLLLLFGFLLFRMIDICKPWPISFIDKNMRNGLGIILDDLLSAIISVICIYLFDNSICNFQFNNL